MQEQSNAPWWKHGYVWLLIGGPAVVVVAALVTVWIAARSPDPVLAEGQYRQSVDVRKNAANYSLMPAMQGRNHAATPAPGR